MSEDQQTESSNKEVKIDDVIYLINEEEMTAGIFQAFNYKPDLIIPKSIKYESKEYLVTSVLPSGFKCSHVKSPKFSIDSQIKSFDEDSFSYSKIESITIPSQLIDVKKGWCKSTEKLTKFEINPGNQYFKSYNDQLLLKKSKIEGENYDLLVFCVRNIEKVTIPSFIEQICPYAFEQCQQLKQVEFEPNSKLKIIDQSSFQSTNIEKISIPSTVTTIGKYSFSDCEKLQQIEIQPDSQLEIIDEFALEYTSIERIIIPSKLKELNEGWHSYSKKLKEIIVDENNQYFKLFNNNKFLLKKSKIDQENFDILVYSVDDIEKEIIIPNFIKNINSYCFQSIKKLEKVEFENNSQLQSIGDYSFSDTSINKKILIPSTVTFIGKYAFEGTNLQIIEFENDSKLQIIDDVAFNAKIKKITIPSSVTKIGCQVFSSELNQIEFSINSKLQEISYGAFENTLIEKIIIPSQVKCIGRSAFANCEKLKSVEFEENSQLQKICDSAFEITSIEKIKIPISVKIIGNKSLSCGCLKYIEIPDNCELQTIEANAFQYSKIEFLNIPSKCIDLKDSWCKEVKELTKIVVSKNNPRYMSVDNKFVLGKSKIEQKNFDLFVFCARNVKSFFVPNFVEHICSESFEFCRKLKSIEFEKNSKLKTINNYAFSYNHISKFELPSEVVLIGNYAFVWSSALKKFIIHEDSKLLKIENNAFWYTAIQSLSLPEKLKEIGGFAFENCPILRIVEIKSKIESIDKCAFRGCKNTIFLVPYWLSDYFLSLDLSI